MHFDFMSGVRIVPQSQQLSHFQYDLPIAGVAKPWLWSRMRFFARFHAALLTCCVSSKGLLRYGTELFSVLYSSKNIPYRNFVPRKNTVLCSTVRNFFRTVIPYLSVPHFFNQFTSRKIQQENFAIATSKFRFIVFLF